MSWAIGMLAATRRLSIFGTIHSPLINPVFAAKQIVTADHIGMGRFGLNVVSGWNKTEFKMFGVGLREHDQRYEYTTEWLDIVKRIWSETKPFDYNGQFFQLEGVVGSPKPYFGDRPLLMSAGSSPAGRAFAAKHADCLFMHLVDETTLADEISALRNHAASLGRADRIGVFSSGHVVCRPTQKEAEDYYEYYAVEKADMVSVETLMRTRAEGRSMSPGKAAHNRRLLASGIGTFAIVGSPGFRRREVSSACRCRAWTEWRSGSSTISMSFPSSLPKSCRGWNGSVSVNTGRPRSEARRRRRWRNGSGLGKISGRPGLARSHVAADVRARQGRCASASGVDLRRGDGAEAALLPVSNISRRLFLRRFDMPERKQQQPRHRRS